MLSEITPRISQASNKMTYISNLLENRDEFQSALGQFVIRFSELEFSLLYFCGAIDHPRNENLGIKENLATTFEQRRNKISFFIRSELPEIADIWNGINERLGNINRDRRFLVHGIGCENFFLHSVKAFIPQKTKVDLKDFTIADIKSLSDQISHLLTGENGLSGEFIILFKTKRFDLHNRTTKQDDKIIFRVNGKIMTEYTE